MPAIERIHLQTCLSYQFFSIWKSIVRVIPLKWIQMKNKIEKKKKIFLPPSKLCVCVCLPDGSTHHSVTSWNSYYYKISVSYAVTYPIPMSIFSLQAFGVCTLYIYLWASWGEHFNAKWTTHQHVIILRRRTWKLSKIKMKFMWMKHKRKFEMANEWLIQYFMCGMRIKKELPIIPWALRIHAEGITAPLKPQYKYIILRFSLVCVKYCFFLSTNNSVRAWACM